MSLVNIPLICYFMLQLETTLKGVPVTYLTCSFYRILKFVFILLFQAIHGHKLEFSSDQSLYDYVKYKMAHSDFVHGFIASLSMIIVSELGDKTFFIAAIMSMRHSRTVVLAGALGALIAMTILSGMLLFLL